MKEVFVIDGTEEREIEVQLKDIKRRIEKSGEANGYANGQVSGVSSVHTLSISAHTPLLQLYNPPLP